MIFSRKGKGRRDERARAHWVAEISPNWRDPSAREPEPLETPEFGPYDSTVAPDDGVPRIDLGSLRVPNLPDTPVQVEAAPNGQIVRVQLEHKGSRLQLAAYAAPRTEGIWDEVREEVRTALLGSGAKVVEVDSDYGPALAVRQGGTGGTPVIESRHLGIDGPRWFVHAVFIGPAASDPSQAPALWEALRGLVVYRGKEPRPVKELLPLRLPAELAARIAQMAARQAAAQAAAVRAAQASGGQVTAAQVAAAQAAIARAAAAQAQAARSGAGTAQASAAPSAPAVVQAAPDTVSDEAGPAEAALDDAVVDEAEAVDEEVDEVVADSDSAVSATKPVAATAGERKAAVSPRPGRKASGRSGARSRRSR